MVPPLFRLLFGCPRNADSNKEIDELRFKKFRLAEVDSLLLFGRVRRDRKMKTPITKIKLRTVSGKVSKVPCSAVRKDSRTTGLHFHQEENAVFVT